MNATPAQLKQQLDPIAVKKEQWGNYGLKLDSKEAEWSIEAAKIIKSLVVPERIEDVPAAEAALAEAKRRVKALDEARMPYTRKMNEIVDRCMKHVKAVEPEIEANQKKIVALKTDHANKQRQQQAIDQERQRIKLAMKNYLIECEAYFKEKIQDLVNVLYTSCLNSNKTHAEALADVEMAKSKCTEYDFIIPKKVFASQIIQQAEIEQHATEILVTDQAAWVREFNEVIDRKFSDYEVALANREAALAKAEQEKTEKQAEIQAEKTNASIAASIETSANLFSAPQVKYGKDLKRTMVVDMPETEHSAKIIDAAFMANWEKCAKYLKVTKWFSLNISQKITALGKLKTDDERFSFTGLNFREEVK